MKKSVIWRFLITYMCVLLPVLIVSALVMQSFLNNTVAGTKKSIEQQVSDAAVLLTGHYRQMAAMESSLYASGQYSSKDILENPAVCMSFVSLLKTANDFGHQDSQIVVWFGAGSFITAAGTVHPEIYFGTSLQCDQTSVDKAISVINGREEVFQFLHGTSAGGYLMYYVPGGVDGYGYHRSMIIVSSVSQVGRLLRSALRSDDILFQMEIGGELSYFHNTKNGCSYLTEEEAEELLTDAYYPTKTIDHGNIKYQIYCDLDAQMVKIYHIRDISVLLLCAGLLVSVVISLTFSFRRFSSIENLTKSLSRRVFAKTDNKRFGTTEIDYIQTLFHGYISENISSHKKMAEYRELLRRQISTLMLHGSLRNKEEIRSALKACGSELYEEFFFVLGIEVENQQMQQQLDVLLQGDIHCVITDYEKEMVFVFCGISCDDHTLNERRRTANRLLSTLESVNIPCTRLAISRVYSDLGEANYAYLESYNMLTNLSDPKYRIITWEEFVQLDGNDGTKLSSTYINEFRSALAARDAVAAVEALSAACGQKELAADEESLQELRYIFCQLLVAETNTLEETSTDESIIDELNKVDLSDQDKFEASISRILQKYFNEIETAETVNKILQFVNENCCQYNFSLESVSEFADCSPSKISKLFRSRVGISYLDYVTRLRMTKAKELLEQTQMSVKDVFSAVGYQDVTNAGKKFQAYFGIKPSACREEIKAPPAAPVVDTLDVP